MSDENSFINPDGVYSVSGKYLLELRDAKDRLEKIREICDNAHPNDYVKAINAIDNILDSEVEK